VLVHLSHVGTDALLRELEHAVAQESFVLGQFGQRHTDVGRLLGHGQFSW